MQISTLDEVSIARLYDTKNFSPETYERLLLDAPLLVTTKQDESGKLFVNKLRNNLVGQTSQGSFSKLHVLKWDEEANEEHRRGLFWTYGGEYNRGNIIQLRDVNVYGESRLRGDVLHVVVPEICGGIVGVEVIENDQSFDDPINVCFSTTRGCLFSLRFLHPLSEMEGNKWRNGLSFLCSRVFPELPSIVSPEVLKGNLEEQEYVTSCKWVSNSKAFLGLSSGRIILTHFPRASSRTARSSSSSGRRNSGKSVSRKSIVKEIVLEQEVSFASRIWNGLGFGGSSKSSDATLGSVDTNDSKNAVFAISTSGTSINAIYGNGIMRLWDLSTNSVLVELDLAKDFDEDHGSSSGDGSNSSFSRTVISSKIISKTIDGFGTLVVCNIGFTNGAERLFFFEQNGESISLFDLDIANPNSVDESKSLLDLSLGVNLNADNSISLRLLTLYVSGDGSEYLVLEYVSSADSVFRQKKWNGPYECSTLQNSSSARLSEDEDLYFSDDLRMTSIVEHFQRRVFFPQRFHRNTIVQALHSCYPEDRDVDSLDDFNIRLQTVNEGGLGLQNSGDSDRDFCERLTAIINHHVHEIAQRKAAIMYNRLVTDDFQVPEDVYASVSEEEWMKLLKNCVSEWKNSNAPLSLYFSSGQHGSAIICGIARRCSIGTFRPLTDYEMFVCSEVDYNNEGMILFAAAKEISTICSQCSDVARDYLHDLQSFHCKDLVLDIVSDHGDPSSPYDFISLAKDKLDFLSSLPTSGATIVLQECMSKIGMAENINETLVAALKMLLPTSIERVDGNTTSYAKSSENGCAAGAVFRKDLKARTIICRDLCLFFAFAEKYDLIENSENYLHETLNGLRSFITVGWLSDQIFKKPCRRVTVALADDIALKTLGRPQIDNVVNINDDIGNSVLDLWCSELGISMYNTEVMLRHIWPSETSDVAAEYLASHGQIEWLKGYTKLLMCECSFDDLNNFKKVECGRRHTHLLGEAYLGARDNDLAFQHFLRAAPLKPAALRTRYLLAIVEMFSSTIGSPELALQCARIAIATCDSIMDASVQEDHRNTLWHIIFQQTLKCRRYDEACVAASSLVDPNEQKVCLKRLIYELQDKNQMDWLCRLPWESMLGGVDNVIKYLEQKMMSAKASLANGTVFHFLYALSIKYGSYRTAANAMYQLATRLLEQSHAGGPPEIRRARSNALVAATNALRLLPADEACLVLDSNISYQKSDKRNRNDGDQRAEDEDNENDVEELKRSKSRVKILWLDDISKEAFLEQSRQKISTTNPALVGAEDTLNLLLHDSRNSDGSSDTVSNDNQNINRNYAVSLAAKFDISLEPVVRATASRCVKLTGGDAVAEELHLKRILKDFDSVETNFKYHLMAVDAILKVDARIDPPEWLIESLLGGDTSLSYSNLGWNSKMKRGQICSANAGFAASNGNAEALVRILMQYGRYRKACTICTHLLAQVFYHIRSYLASTGEGSLPPDEPWIPRSLLDDLLRESHDVIDQNPSREDIQIELKSSVDRLEKQIYIYFNAVVALDGLRQRNIGRP